MINECEKTHSAVFDSNKPLTVHILKLLDEKIEAEFDLRSLIFNCIACLAFLNDPRV